MILDMTEKVKTVIELYFRLPDFKSRGHPKSMTWTHHSGEKDLISSPRALRNFWKKLKIGKSYI